MGNRCSENNRLAVFSVAHPFGHHVPDNLHAALCRCRVCPFSAAGLCADRFYDFPPCELHSLRLCGFSCRESEYEADGALYRDVSHGAGAESACHVVLHRPSWDMVYVFKGRGFCDRDDLELFH